MSANIDRLSVSVFGRVQGVSFRYYTRREAVSLGLTGWVRNETDGSVKVVAEGERHQLKLFLAFLRKGPPGAHVYQVQEEWSRKPGEFGVFEIRWL